MQSMEKNELINKFLSLILYTFKAKYHYFDIKAHYDEKCDDIANPKLVNKRNELMKICYKFKLETDTAYSKYNSLNNSLNKFCLNLSKNDLKQIIEYFDYPIKNNTKNEIIDGIIKYIIEDIKKIYEYNIEHIDNSFFIKSYKGPISLIEIILVRKEKHERDIKNYKDIEKKLIQVELTHQIYTNSRLKERKELENLRSSTFNLIFRRRLIEKLTNEQYDKYVQITKLADERYKLIEKYEESIQKKNSSYNRYKRISSLIPYLLDRVGEKTLRDLIKYLNITIVKSENNYFNEKEEMKFAIKRWFNYETKKIDREFNIEDRVLIDRGQAEKKLTKR